MSPARRTRASANPLTTVLLDPKFVYTLVVAVLTALGFTVSESGEKRDGGFREGFYACFDRAHANRDAGKKKIIPIFREEYLEEEPQEEATQ